MIRVGIPRGLLYYSYFPLWRVFFTEMGAEVVVSPETNKTILDAGLRSALDEACLPVKLFFGHVLALVGSVDYLLVPRLISVEPKAYICPKFMGLPDMLRARIPDLPPLIDVEVDFSHARRPRGAVRRRAAPCGNWERVLSSMGRLFDGDRRLIGQACRSAQAAQSLFQERLEKGWLLPEALYGRAPSSSPASGLPARTCTPPSSSLAESPAALRILQAERRPEAGVESLNIALLGHAYNIYDGYISMNLIERLKALGARVATADLVPQAVIDEQAGTLPKKLFWTLGKKMIGAALSFCDSGQFDGMIYLSSFGCGPESLVGELLARWAKRSGGIPFMLLTIDEHTGAAGLVTRLEAFTDMLKRRNQEPGARSQALRSAWPDG
jgi:predicted nucleotide-binding protein (sugar kinase/HSP70/actin superfamily)